MSISTNSGFKDMNGLVLRSLISMLPVVLAQIAGCGYEDMERRAVVRRRYISTTALA